MRDIPSSPRLQSTWLYKAEENHLEQLSGEVAPEIAAFFMRNNEMISYPPGTVFHVVYHSGEFLMSSEVHVLSARPLVCSGMTRVNRIEELTSDNHPASVSRLFAFTGHENIVHALKAPVNRIRGIAQILQSAKGDQVSDELIAYLSQSSEKLRELVVEILDRAALSETSNLLTHDLHESLNSICQGKEESDRPWQSQAEVANEIVAELFSAFLNHCRAAHPDDVTFSLKTYRQNAGWVMRVPIVNCAHLRTVTHHLASYHACIALCKLEGCVTISQSESFLEAVYETGTTVRASLQPSDKAILN